jgi:cytochrome c oxidase cbb3-type subunit II
MPSFRYLYRKQRVGSAPSADAIRFAGRGGPPEGWEIVPTQDAKNLVAYLMSLDQSHPLNEVKPPPGAGAPVAQPAAPAPGTGAGQ